jgi:glucose-1-phosphate thymidylyltransferase
LKGIIIAGGTGSRLSPLTGVISKTLLPVYDKPMIYYPLSVLIQAGINDILIITTPSDKPRFVDLLGDGSHLGISLCYEAEPAPKGIAQAFIIGEKFIGNDPVALILGDNIFHGHGLHTVLHKAMKANEGATIFGYFVKDPKRFGVVDMNASGKVLSIEEKPCHPKSNYAVTGLYFYDSQVVAFAKKLEPSARGELEITDINKAYLEMDALHVKLLEEEYSWIDTGTHESLFEAALFIKDLEKKQHIKLGCIEEAAFKEGFISRKQLEALAKPLLNSGYGEYLMKVANKKQ